MRTIILVLLSLTLLATAVAAEETLSGLVLGPDNQPLAGATVVAMKYTSQRGGNAVELTTDAEGRFSYQTEMPTGWELAAIGMPALARKAGFAMALGKLSPKVPTTLKLGDKPETRSGLVLDPSGKPLAGVAVRLNAIMAPEAPDGRIVGLSLYGLAWADAKTDDAGRFSFADFPPDLIASVRLTAEGFAGAAVRLENASPLSITLGPEATISGKVLVNGQPQEGLTVFANRRDGNGGVPCNAKTAPDGTYLLRGLAPGQVSVYAQAPKDVARLGEQLLTVKPGQTITGIDFNFTPGALVRGKVTDARTGQPVEKAIVTAMQGTQGLNSAVADAEGKYELRLPPGTYRLQATPRQAAGGYFSPTPPSEDEQLTCKEGEVIEAKDLVVRLPRKITVQLLLPDGKPATEAQVWSTGAFGSTGTILDANARFDLSLPDVPAGPERAYFPATMLVATEPAKNLAALASVDPRAQNLPDTLTVKLQPAATALVSITDEQNQPLAGYGVFVGYPMGEGGRVSRQAGNSDQRGLIRLTCLPAGTKLFLSPNDPLRGLMLDPDWGREPLTLTAGETRQLPPIVVNPAGRSLQVFVGDATGKPVAKAQVFASGFQPPALTDDKGQATLTKLPLRGRATLVAVHPTEDWFAIESLEPTGDYWPGLLLKPLGKATGLLISKPGGKPLEGYQLYVTANTGRADFWRLDNRLHQRLGTMSNRDVLTDADGRWHATNLLPNVEYEVIARPKAGTQGPVPNWGGRLVGRFTAEGGETEQDAGVFEFEAPDGQ